MTQSSGGGLLWDVTLYEYWVAGTWALISDHLDENTSSATYQLHDLGQIPYLLCTSISSSIKWGSNCTSLMRLL